MKPWPIPGGLTRPLPRLGLGVELGLPEPSGAVWRALAVVYVAFVAAVVAGTIWAIASMTTPTEYRCPHDPPQEGDICWQESPNGPDLQTDPA